MDNKQIAGLLASFCVLAGAVFLSVQSGGDNPVKAAGGEQPAIGFEAPPSSDTGSDGGVANSAMGSSDYDKRELDLEPELEPEPGPDSDPGERPALPPASLVGPAQQVSWAEADFFADVLRQQDIDSAWAQDAEAALLGALSTLKLPVQTIMAHCRSTICRLEVALDVGDLDAGGTEDIDIGPYQQIMGAVRPVSRAEARFTAASGSAFVRTTMSIHAKFHH